MTPAPVIELVVDCNVTRDVPPAVTAAPIDSAPVAVRLTLPLLVLTVPLVVRPPVFLTVQFRTEAEQISGRLDGRTFTVYSVL